MAACVVPLLPWQTRSPLCQRFPRSWKPSKDSRRAASLVTMALLRFDPGPGAQRPRGPRFHDEGPTVEARGGPVRGEVPLGSTRPSQSRVATS